MEDHLNGYLKELIGQLPKEEHDQISREIQEEDLRLRQEMEAAKNIRRSMCGNMARKNISNWSTPGTS